MALVGANGAGKTTLLRAIAGAHLPSGGRIVLRCHRCHRHAVLQEGRHGHRAGSGGTTAVCADDGRGESAAWPAPRAGPGDWTVDVVMETFPQLKPRRHAKAGNLSGGEQQATAIGRALMTNPEVLLLDEVSLGLSPIAVERVYASLAALMKSGTTCITRRAGSQPCDRGRRPGHLHARGTDRS